MSSSWHSLEAEKVKRTEFPQLCSLALGAKYSYCPDACMRPHCTGTLELEAGDPRQIAANETLRGRLQNSRSGYETRDSTSDGCTICAAGSSDHHLREETLRRREGNSKGQSLVKAERWDKPDIEPRRVSHLSQYRGRRILDDGNTSTLTGTPSKEIAHKNDKKKIRPAQRSAKYHDSKKQNTHQYPAPPSFIPIPLPPKGQSTRKATIKQERHQIPSAVPANKLRYCCLGLSSVFGNPTIDWAKGRF
ncbi:hypothetical protein C8R44DRAFT_746231 [Mycena epipterygia]|nr:hypothetical protein C8R44DRAFT_746231 [Mycena epipterygia]